MNSKEINLFLSPEDMIDVELFFLEKKCLIFERKIQFSGVPRKYDITKNLESVFQVCICREEDKDKYFMRKLKIAATSMSIFLKVIVLSFLLVDFVPIVIKNFTQVDFIMLLSIMIMEN